MKSRLLLGLLVAMLFQTTIHAQEPAPVFNLDSLETYVKDQQALWKIPAVAIAIVEDGKVVKQIVNGVTGYQSNTPIDENSLFMIGSNTKAFTSILMATLAAEEKISLTDPVKKWLPYFKMKDPWLTEKVNIIDVLSHRVGFETFQGDFLNFDNELGSQEIIKKFALIEPTHGYREQWGYFNTGYTIAGEIINVATTKTWAEQIRERIFQPLEMDHSLALSKEIITAENRTLAHTLIADEPVVMAYGDIDATAPAGSISSSIADMAKWVAALLADGKVDENQVIPVEAINETITPRSIKSGPYVMFNRSQFSLYGLGWDLQDYEGYKMIMHTGGIHGYLTSVTTIPEKNLGIVVLTNTDSNYFFEAIKWDIVDAYLQLPHRAHSPLYHGYFKESIAARDKERDQWKKQVEKGISPSVKLKKFVGTYTNEVYGWLKISEKGNDLHIDFQHHKDLTVQLSHTENDQFLAVFSNPLYGQSIFPFEVVDREVKQFTLKLDPQVEKTTYDFVKE